MDRAENSEGHTYPPNLVFLGATGANREGGGGRIDPPPPARPRYEKCPARARVNAVGFGDLAVNSNSVTFNQNVSMS